MNNDSFDYGERQRLARLLAKYAADKPVYRPRVRVIVAIMVTWTVGFLTWWFWLRV